MSAPYSTVSVSGYNSNPPADDGSQVASNQLKWSTIKGKLSDPLNTFSAAIDSALVTAFTKIIGGAGVTSTAVDYTVQSSDQGKLVRATASSITVTTPDATVVNAPFVFAVLNNSSGTITLDGNGSQTVDGNANLTVPAGSGMMLFTDGSNWFTTGVQGTPVGKQLMFSDIINGTIAESNGANAVTFSLKTLAGNDPSVSDPVLLCFRNATVGTGNYVYRTVTSALTLTISSGSTMGASNNVAFGVWVVIFDDAGTIRLGAINTVSGTNIYPLGQNPIASSTAEGGAGAADSAQVFYTGTAVTSKPYLILAKCNYESGLSTAGSWNVSPTRIRLFDRACPLPGTLIQVQSSDSGAVATGTTLIPDDDTIPQNTEGDQYFSQAITPTSAANILIIESQLNCAGTVNLPQAALFQDSTANALSASHVQLPTNNAYVIINLSYRMLAGTNSSTTFKIRAGLTSAGTFTLNGNSSARKLGGVMNSYLRTTEIMT